MSRRVRTGARIGAVLGLALLLTGCIKLNMNMVVNSDDTVSGTIQLGVQKELIELSGQSVEDLLGTDVPLPSDVPGVTVEQFDDGEFAGQQYTFESVPLAEFAGSGAEEISITRDGDTFVITGVLDLSSGLSGASGFTGFGATGQELLESADIRLSFTFPGDVVEANGQIDGNTVTYAPEFGERLEISATGSAVDDGDAEGVVGGDDGGSNLVLILIIVGALIVAAIVIFLILRSRKRRDGGAAAEGFGEAPPATAPVSGGPAPAAPTPDAGAADPVTPPPMPPAAPPPPPSDA